MPGLERAGDRDADSGLNFVPREHPDLDPGVPNSLQRLLDVLLEQVLDAREADEIQARLEALDHLLATIFRKFQRLACKSVSSIYSRYVEIFWLSDGC